MNDETRKKMEELAWSECHLPNNKGEPEPDQWAYEVGKKLFAAGYAESEKRAHETLNWIMPKVHQAYHEGEIADCQKAVCVEYRKAIGAK